MAILFLFGGRADHPACSMKDQIEHARRTAIRKLVSEELEVDITMGQSDLHVSRIRTSFPE